MPIPLYPQYFVNNGNVATVTSVYGSGANLQNGNVGRNSVRGPGMFNLDIGISRDIPFYREYKLQLKGEAFGLTNTPQWANPSANINAPTTFGQITHRQRKPHPSPERSHRVLRRKGAVGGSPSCITDEGGPPDPCSARGSDVQYGCIHAQHLCQGSNCHGVILPLWQAAAHNSTNAPSTNHR